MDEYVLKEVFEERMKATDAENDRQNHRLTSLEKTFESLNQLVVSVEKLAVAVNNMQKELEKQGKRLDDIEAEPADNWKGLVKTVITVLATAAITYFITKGGM